MTLEQMHGNDELRVALAGMLDSGRIPHALMLHEDDGGGAMSYVLAFLQQLYGSDRVSKMIHPDVHFIFPVLTGDLSKSHLKEWRTLVQENPRFTESDLNAAIGIEGKSALIAVPEAKAMLETLSLSALEGGYRSVVIYLPEKLNQEAANRLLKIIEEPPLQTQFMLVTHSPEKVLQTIVSRCQQLRVAPEGIHAVTSDDSGLFAPLMDALVSRDLASALEVGEQIAALPSRASAKSFCKFASERCRGIFLVQQGLQQLAPTDDRIIAWASKCRKTFPRAALEILDRTMTRIDRNVNQKILFTDLVDRLFFQI